MRVWPWSRAGAIPCHTWTRLRLLSFLRTGSPWFENAALRVSTLLHFCYASPSKIKHTGETSLSLLCWSQIMYDLLLKGGTVVDPSAGLHGVHDIAVQDGKIARIAPFPVKRPDACMKWRARSSRRA